MKEKMKKEDIKKMTSSEFEALLRRLAAAGDVQAYNQAMWMRY